ncbi:MAG: exodeoxyribonuclease VII large subunit [Candidatus Omnitrophica bacterium]|nr:exodeoxyribonuclease VII large subunit [Candidatus Omnitrophota bacterium]
MEIRLRTEKVYSIRELNTEIRNVLNQEFPDLIWIHGEIQDYDKNKHKPDVYFRLCEKHPEIDEIIASAAVVIFKDRKPILASTLKKTEGQFELKDDLEVKLLCKVDLFPRSGKFILIVEGIDPVYTLGKLAQSRQRIIEELKTKWLLEKNKKLTLPLVPLNIGLITSYNSAAYNDFLDELKKSKYGFKLYLFDSFMQGKNVEGDICYGLELFNQMDLDLVVITRGGGATSDLSWFDNKRIAESIANSKLPVLTGIGHEINITIADLVAHTSFKTPTAIAQFLVNRVKEFLDILNDNNRLIMEKTKGILLERKQTLQIKAKSIGLATHEFLRLHREDLASLIKETRLNPLNLVHNLRLKLKFIEKEIHLDKFKKILTEKMELLLEKWEDLKRAYPMIIKDNLRDLKHYEERIKILDPMNTVKRGFSITRAKDGRILRSIKDAKKGNELITIVFDGKIKSKVERTERSKNA